MSTILKALQKVEGKRRVGDTPLPPNLSLAEKPESGRHGARAFLLLLIAGMLIGAGGWQVYNRLTAWVANPVLSGPGGKDADAVPSLFQGTPAAVGREADVPSQAWPAGSVPAESSAISRTSEPSAAEVVSALRVGSVKPAVRKRAAAKPAAGRPVRLVVSGIAFQEDRVERVAVVNDRPVMEGEKVGGAVVTAILEDRVRFSRKGKTFEIGLAAREDL
jgi:hypothetical protein